MKILLVINKTLQRGIFNRIDGGYWNFYLPMLQLGHEVVFFDTSQKNEKSFLSIVEEFKPSLIFSCLTFNKNYMPNEPIEEIKQITEKGNIKTFNWFCDDTWRFEETSQKNCWNFTACSTPEPKFINKYKEIGYKNIFLGLWHVNSDLCQINEKKLHDIGFCGGLNSQRANMIQSLRRFGINVNMFFGGTNEDMLTNYSLSRIGINFSVNENDPERKTQMKLRMMEVPAVRSLLLTEYTEGLEQIYDINKEIITFKTEEEMLEKIKFLLNNEKICEKVAEAGHKRFLREHESKIRLRKILEEIEKI